MLALAAPGFITPGIVEKTSDGITWTKMGLVQDLGTPGDPDDSRADSGSVIFDEGIHKVWYSGYDGAHWRVLYSTSPDGVAWTKQGVVLDLGSPGEFDDDSVMSPSVLRKDNGTYQMWYHAQSTSLWGWRIGYATSRDGLDWVRHGIVLDIPCKTVAHPNVLIDETGTYRMWFSVYDGEHWRIGQAISTEGVNWVDMGVVLDVGKPGDPDSEYVYFPAVMTEPDGSYIMFYCHYDGGTSNVLDVQYATSPDGLGASWTKMRLSLMHGDEGDYDEIQAIPTTIRMRPDGLHELYYTGFDGSHRRMMLAVERPGEIEATIICHPNTLNLKSMGNWITCFIELPSGYDPREIVASTILLNGVLAPELDPKYGFVGDEDSYITDYDEDGVEERMVKFDREVVQILLDVGLGMGITLTGELKDGTKFKGSDSVRVIDPPEEVPVNPKSYFFPHQGRVTVIDGRIPLSIDERLRYR